jgi:hypothetical protein
MVANLQHYQRRRHRLPPPFLHQQRQKRNVAKTMGLNKIRWTFRQTSADGQLARARMNHSEWIGRSKSSGGRGGTDDGLSGNASGKGGNSSGITPCFA